MTDDVRMNIFPIDVDVLFNDETVTYIEVCMVLMVAM